MNWAPFASLWASFNSPFLAAINAQTTNLCAAVALPAMLATTIYIVAMTAMDLFGGGGGGSGNPVLDLARRCIKPVIILTCLQAGTYISTVSNLLLVTLPGELAQAVAGGTAVGAGAFDHLSGEAWKMVSQAVGNITWKSLASLVPAIWSLLFLLEAMLGIATMFALWAITQVGLGLVVAVGPLALACLINPQTARFFNGWLATVATFIIAQVMLVTLVSLTLTTINNNMVTVLADAAQTASLNDVTGAIHGMMNAGLMFGVALVVTLSVGPIARAIGGGAAAELAPFARWASGNIGAVHAAVGNAAVSGAKAAGSALNSTGTAGMRSIKPVGRAIG